MAIGGAHTLNPSLVHECAPRGTGRQITESAQQFCRPVRLHNSLPAFKNNNGKNAYFCIMKINTIPFLKMKNM